MKKILTSILAAIVLNTTLSAQNDTTATATSNQGKAIEFYYGIRSLDATSISFSNQTDKYTYVPGMVSTLYNKYGIYTDNGRYFGSFGLSYIHTSKKVPKIDIIYTAHTSFFLQDVHNMFTGEKKRAAMNLTLMGMMDFRAYWFRQKYVSMYTEFGYGVQFIFSNNPGDISFIYAPALQFHPVGITVGDKIYGHFSFGVGAQSCIQFGLGYKL